MNQIFANDHFKEVRHTVSIYVHNKQRCIVQVQLNIFEKTHSHTSKSVDSRAANFFFYRFAPHFIISIRYSEPIKCTNQKLMHNSRFANHQTREGARWARERNENHRHFVFSVECYNPYLTFSRAFCLANALLLCHRYIICVFQHLPISKYLMTDLLAFFRIVQYFSTSISNVRSKFCHYLHSKSSFTV